MPEKGLFGRVKEALVRLNKHRETPLERAVRILEGIITDEDRGSYVNNQMSAASISSLRGYDAMGVSSSAFDTKVEQLLHASPEEIDARLVRDAQEKIRLQASKIPHR